MQRRRLPAEWEPQDGVLLAWPHPATDWLPVLDRVEPVFAAIAREISRHQTLLLIAHDRGRAREQLLASGADLSRVRWFPIPTNDTWARDFGPLVVRQEEQPVLLDFRFDGWGGKFPAELDDQVTGRLHEAGAFGELPLERKEIVLEGGSMESDGQGTLLTTSRCLLHSRRNPRLGQAELENELGRSLGADRVLWLHHGHLEGDDTDAHVDTLARFAPEDTIVHVQCDDPEDPHYPSLQRMAKELGELRTRTGAPYRLLPLPWPRARFDADGDRLPATYANFLVINEAVLMPTYDDPCDLQAAEVLMEAFPRRRVVGIPCLPLLLQHGSLHCLTMQLPRGVLP